MIDKHVLVNAVYRVRRSAHTIGIEAYTHCGAMKFVLLGWMIAPMRRGTRLLFVGLVLIGLNAQSARAGDAPTLTGHWSATSLTSKWVVGQWGDACGPKPGGSAPAGEVTVTQGGSELTISGAGGTYRTNACWEQHAGARVVSHTGGNRAWKTICKTGPTDSRQATITTTLTATDDAITFYETGQYQFSSKGQNCTASVGRYRNFRLIQRAGEEPATAGSSSAGAPETKPGEDRCASPGPPARVEIRPSRRLMRPGESFAFKAVVLDAKGCALRNSPTWSVVQGGEHAQMSNGTVSIAADAPEGEVRVNAGVGERSAGATVEVASKERYEALLKGAAPDEAGPAPVASTATKSIGTKTTLAEDKGERRKMVFVALVGAVAVILGIAGLLMVRRTRKVQRAQAARMKAETAAEPPPPPIPPTPQNTAPKRKICPICGTHYPPEFQFCGSDGASLVPIN